MKKQPRKPKAKKWGGTKPETPDLVADLSQATAATIEQIRAAFRVPPQTAKQKMIDRYLAFYRRAKQ